LKILDSYFYFSSFQEFYYLPNLKNEKWIKEICSCRSDAFSIELWYQDVGHSGFTNCFMNPGFNVHHVRPVKRREIGSWRCSWIQVLQKQPWNTFNNFLNTTYDISLDYRTSEWCSWRILSSFSFTIQQCPGIRCRPNVLPFTILQNSMDREHVSEGKIIRTVSASFLLMLSCSPFLR